MADNATLMKALRNAHNAGDEVAAKRIATMIQGQASPQPAVANNVAPGLPDFTKPQGMDAAMTKAKGLTLGDVGQFADDIVRQGANGVSFGLADRLAALGSSTLDEERLKSQQAYDRTGMIGTAAEIAGSLLPMSAAMKVGATATRLPGMVGKYGGSLIDGSLFGGADAAGRGNDVLPAMALGAAGGGVGQLAGLGLGKAAKAIGDKINISRASVENQALQKIYDSVSGYQKVTPSTPALPTSPQIQLDALGPDAMVGDVLGQRGYAMARKAANLNPDARETLVTALGARKAGQNNRVVSDLEKAAGLPAGNVKTVDDFKSAEFAKVSPQINQAYKEFRDAGQDIPLDYFKDVINSPMGEGAFKEAVGSLQNRMAVSGESAGGNAAVIDEMKKILDSKAEMARRSGDRATADVASNMARHLRFQMDAALEGSQYSTARALRQKAYKTDDAFDMGSDLAKGRVPLGKPQEAMKLDPEYQKYLAQGYTAKQAENFLNKGSGEGALNGLVTPQGKDAYTAALGENAPMIDKAVKREKTFNRFNNAVGGNSTTAQQIADIGGFGLGGAAAGYLSGMDPTTSSAMGLISAALRKGGPALARKMATAKQVEMAPIIAEILASNKIPKKSPIDPAKVNIEAIVKALTASGIAGSLQMQN